MLKAKNICLCPLTAEDSQTLFGWINDRELVLRNSCYRPVHEERHNEWFKEAQTSRDSVLFGIRLNRGGRLIGTCQLSDINHIHSKADLSIRIGEKSEQGKGYGTEAVRLLLDFAFKDLNLNRVQLHVFAFNAPAVKLYEKCGFVKEGLLRKAAHIDGQHVDVVMMGVLRSEHENSGHTPA